MIQRLKEKKGETLIETLMAIIVATLVLLFLATSIVTATRVNKTVEETDTSFNYPEEDKKTAESLTVVIEDENKVEKGSASVYQYTDSTGNYRYYKGVNDDD